MYLTEVGLRSKCLTGPSLPTVKSSQLVLGSSLDLLEIISSGRDVSQDPCVTGSPDLASPRKSRFWGASRAQDPIATGSRCTTIRHSPIAIDIDPLGAYYLTHTDDWRISIVTFDFATHFFPFLMIERIACE